jgi:hypothetical protein
MPEDFFTQSFTRIEGDPGMMLGEQIAGHTVYKAQTLSLREYMADLERSGVEVLSGAPGTFWTRHESGAMMRRPTFYVGLPEEKEVQQVLWRGRAGIASYLLEPDEGHPANAWLYICTDQTYALEKLPSPMRRNVRRGLRELRITPLTADQVLAHGVEAFCETRRRVGLSDGTPEEFRRRYTVEAKLPEIAFIGSWKDDQLAAFLSIVEVDDWVEIGCFSMDALLQYRPNDTLMYTALSHYLVERKCRLVSYGLSSIQAESNAMGLHRFKTKVGFEARPVHRAFVAHPLLRPLVNRATLWTVNAALRLRPADRRLKKAGGVLACMLGDTSALEAAGSSATEQ